MSRTNEQREESERRNFNLALGQFIHTYAFLDRVWHSVLRHFAGVDENLSRAMTGGMRGGEVINTVKRIIKVRNIDEGRQKEIYEVVEQFNAISEFRDRLIHRGADYNTDFAKFVSTNETYYRLLEDFESVTFEPKDIGNATHDLTMISLRLIYCMLGDSPREKELKDGTREWTHAPWRYKRLQPDTPNLETKVRNTPKRGRQPRA